MYDVMCRSAHMLVRRPLNADFEGLRSFVVFFRCRDQESSQIIIIGVVRMLVGLKTYA